MGVIGCIAQGGSCMNDSLVEQVAKQAELQEKRKNALLKFPISRVGSLELHPPVWLARDFLEVGTLGMVFGESGAGSPSWLSTSGSVLLPARIGTDVQ